MSRTEMEHEISAWRSFGDDAVQIFNNILSQRVSYTMTEHRAAEIVAENNRAIAMIAVRINEIMDQHVRTNPPLTNGHVEFKRSPGRPRKILPVATP